MVVAKDKIRSVAKQRVGGKNGGWIGDWMVGGTKGDYSCAKHSLAGDSLSK